MGIRPTVGLGVGLPATLAENIPDLVWSQNIIAPSKEQVQKAWDDGDESWLTLSNVADMVRAIDSYDEDALRYDNVFLCPWREYSIPKWIVLPFGDKVRSSNVLYALAAIRPEYESAGFHPLPRADVDTVSYRSASYGLSIWQHWVRSGKPPLSDSEWLGRGMVISNTEWAVQNNQLYTRMNDDARWAINVFLLLFRNVGVEIDTSSLSYGLYSLWS